MSNLKAQIVDHLRQFGPLTGGQIQRIFFDSKSDKYRRKVVGTLIKEEIVSKVPLRTLSKYREDIEKTPLLGDVLNQGVVSRESKLPMTLEYLDIEKNEWIYFISKKYSFLMHDYTEKTSLTFLGHQLIVGDVFKFLSKYVPERTIQSDSQVLGINGYNRTLLGPVPDLIINFNGKRLAVEVELSTKFSSRYQKKADRYRYAEFDHILYFCASDSVAFKMSQSFKDIKKMHYCLLTNKTNFFRFGDETVGASRLFRQLGVLNVG